MTTAPAPRRGRPPSGGREEILSATLAVLRERGVAKLTTREVAKRAGVSEGSIYYHFTDRFGLLLAVFERGLRPLADLNQRGFAGTDLRSTLAGFMAAVEAFLDPAMDVLTAAQSDADLREALGAHMRDNDLGPHRGITMMGGYLAQQQRLGVVRADVDPETVAYTLVSGCFMRASQERMVGHTLGVASREQQLDMLMTLLAPTGDAVK
ncbi:TetR/AcrR family transcriptional regulator [Rhodococcus sp. UNC363MFTsu5.1]|uniref:TetR/AcrR family transcriptional regulator n=1 Tax=Rhodococcus sp. UNC363MFTsu5.1 TaxID=1449069 RepID=UPI0004847C41|nr:TetR/AcrR family transcriptional regulator [Rhodococcus sp. UNC363MFTsu5.1]